MIHNVYVLSGTNQFFTGAIQCTVHPCHILYIIMLLSSMYSTVCTVYPILGVMVLRHLSCMLLIKISGPDSSVDPPPTLKEKGRDLKHAVEKFECEGGNITRLCRVCLECGKLRGTNNLTLMTDKYLCLACGRNDTPKCELQPLFCWNCTSQGLLKQCGTGIRYACCIEALYKSDQTLQEQAAAS